MVVSAYLSIYVCTTYFTPDYKVADLGLTPRFASARASAQVPTGGADHRKHREMPERRIRQNEYVGSRRRESLVEGSWSCALIAVQCAFSGEEDGIDWLMEHGAKTLKAWQSRNR
jgi:hypothetical protein